MILLSTVDLPCYVIYCIFYNNNSDESLLSNLSSNCPILFYVFDFFIFPMYSYYIFNFYIIMINDGESVDEITPFTVILQDPVSWRGASQIYDRNATLFQRKFQSIVRWVSQNTYDRSAAAFQS